MIFGIGTDIAEIGRMAGFHERHGERALEKLLALEEREACRASADPARFLAKRFAAKEALAKAYGTGVREPLLLPQIAVAHDGLGKPYFVFGPALADAFAARGIKAHLSLSDEREFAIAFVVLETT